MKPLPSRAFALNSGTPISAANTPYTAIFTGKQRQVLTVSYKLAWECEYNYLGQFFTKLFESGCPATVTVQ
jgi:hypothetical protein